MAKEALPGPVGHIPSQLLPGELEAKAARPWGRHAPAGTRQEPGRNQARYMLEPGRN